jgi:S-DNA-T family DNA segregation ATPase FtsK/SpoIIIE
MKKDKEEKKMQKKIKDDGKQKPGLLTNQTKRIVKAVLMFLVALVIVLSFFDRSGNAGEIFIKISKFLIGQSSYTLPLFLVFGGIIFLKSKKKGRNLAMFLAIFISVLGIAGLLANHSIAVKDLAISEGGWIGFLMSWALVNTFGILVANITFGTGILIGLFVFLQFVWQEIPKEVLEEEKKEKQKTKWPLATNPTLSKAEEEAIKTKPAVEEKAEVKSELAKISLFSKQKKDEEDEEKIKEKRDLEPKGNYSLPPLDLLTKNESSPTPGNIKENSMIIKKTFENFGIPVEMAEVNVGPTVTQYAFKPAEGVKLSKITTLSSNLALALAAHPIRIEAPIPGKSLVGIEVPNKIRSIVSLRNLISQNDFQSSASHLLLALGRDVSGGPVYTDITEMPHLLVAGATGTGKTIFLNTLILSLLYKSTPETLRMIMVDPKRVEFQNYNDIPHLLCPVIYDAQKTMNALQWLTKEMERRFEVFSEIPTRNIKTYNQNKSVIASGMKLPYIVLVVDELADLMAAKGKELEAGIVRLAQMARATGIHLVLATQRPSVEVITGTIKANITSRITFQVASQVDSRTVLDTSGAEKLLGAGDMLFVSSKSSKISRIQGPYISEKEVKKVADWVVENGSNVQDPQTALVDALKENLEHNPDAEKAGSEVFFGDNDPLFEDVKKIVLETKKASASFLQRRLRIGYSRAARLIDMLEEQGLVGPADGAKPREVYEGKLSSQDLMSKNPPKESGFDESESSFAKASEDKDEAVAEEVEWKKV